MGLDEPNKRALETIHHAEPCEFHTLLDYEDTIHLDHYPVEDMLQKARAQLDAFDGSVDAIIAQWDFPVTSMVPILCRERGLRSISLESSLKCGHKYWSRLEQQKAIREFVPRFEALNPFDDDAVSKMELGFPFWLKPVKSFGSKLGFKIENEDHFREAIEAIREEIGKIAEPFNMILGYAEMPDEVRHADGYWCLAEQLIEGHELAPEGSMQDGQVRIHGVVDLGLGGPHGKSIEQLRLPSRLPQSVQQRAKDAATKLVKQIDMNEGCFGVEFFWNERTDEMWVVEINPRISQSHTYIFEMTTGQSNHEVAVSVAFGETPRLSTEEGEYEVACKFWLRDYEHEEDSVVTRVPTDEDIARVQERFPSARIFPMVEEGQRLGDLKDQDSDSWLLAEIKLAAETWGELEANYEQVVDMLAFEFDRSRISITGRDSGPDRGSGDTSDRVSRDTLDLASF